MMANHGRRPIQPRYNISNTIITLPMMAKATTMSDMTLLQSMSISEGFPVAGSRPHVNNNPLDLMWGAEAKSFGAIRGDRPGGPHSYLGFDGFAVYEKPKDGWKAAVRWLSVPAHFHNGALPGFFLDPNGTVLVAGYLGSTFAQMLYRFAPPSENNTELYISTNIARVPGLTRETIITHELLQTPEAA